MEALAMLQYAFVQKALVGGIAIAICCPLIGVFLVLRRLSLLGDGLAHVAFGGVAIGFVLGIPPLWAALGAATLGAAGVQKMLRNPRLQGDSAIALVLSLGVGTAVVLLGLRKGFSVDLFSYLFGSILAMGGRDLGLILGVTSVVTGFTFIAWRRLVFLSFHEDLARLTGMRATAWSSLFTVMAAFTVVISIRAVGILMVSALLVIPANAALQLARSFRGTMLLAISFSLFSVIAGIMASLQWDLPPGGTIAVLMCILFLLILAFKSRREGSGLR